MTIKLEQYRIFNEAARTLSFSLASQNLFISQSAISQTILAIEKELNTKLFIRKSKGVSLTKEGEVLYQYTKEALDTISLGEQRLNSMKKLQDGELIISCGDTISSHFLARYLDQFHQQYPKVKLKIINRTTLETIELIKSGQVDIGFVNLPIQEDTLITKECLKVHDIFVANPSYDSSHLYTKEELAALPLILLESNSNTRKFIEESFLKEGIHLKPEIEIGAHDLLLEFAAINLGVSCVVKEFSMHFLKQNLLQELQQATPLPERSIAYAYLKRIAPSPAAETFMKMIDEDITKSF